MLATFATFFSVLFIAASIAAFLFEVIWLCRGRRVSYVAGWDGRGWGIGFGVSADGSVIGFQFGSLYLNLVVLTTEEDLCD